MTVGSRHVVLAGGLLFIAGWVAALSLLMERETYDVWGALVIAPALLLLALPVLSAVARRSDEPWLFSLLVTALLVKSLASLVRYWTAFVLYQGSADAAGYHKAGIRVSDAYRQGIFDVELGNAGIGTLFIERLTGAVYTVSGASLIGGYLIFSWMGFWGLLLCYQAFVAAVPGGHRRRYALMVFFLPSLLFWPSGIGKEAWMTLGFGLCTYGAARLLSHRPGGMPILALGLLATMAVRPHVTLIVAVALIVAYTLRPSRRFTSLTPVLKVGGVMVATAVAVIVVHQTAAFLGLDSVSVEGFEKELSDAQDQTNKGGSAFGGVSLTSPLGVPLALVTVLFRPFPWEVDSVQAVVASLEGMFLMYLGWHFRASLMQVPRLLRRSPFVTFCLVYVLGYVAVFAGFSNFGILVRQRSLALPAFLVLLALPVAARRRNAPESRDRRTEVAA